MQIYPLFCQVLVHRLDEFGPHKVVSRFGELIAIPLSRYIEFCNQFASRFNGARRAAKGYKNTCIRGFLAFYKIVVNAYLAHRPALSES